MSKKIFATNNPYAYVLVDDDVFETIQQFGLKLCVKKDGYWQLTSWIQLPGMAKKKVLSLHRFVWILKTGKESLSSIDHEDLDKSNNQFENLRLATRQQQNQHQNKRKDNTSGMIGVCHHHTNKKSKTGGNHYWFAQIQKPDGKRETKHFPYTDDGLVSAGKWHDVKSIQYFGEFHGQLNFPMPDNN